MKTLQLGLLIGLFMTSCSTLLAQSNEDKTLIYTVDLKTEGPTDYLNAHVDVPVFSGVFGGDHYGFSVGGQLSACLKSKVCFTGRMSFNLSPYVTAGINDFLNYVDHPAEQINTGRLQYTGVARVNFKSELKDVPIYESIGFEDNTRYSVKTEMPLLTTYGVRIGLSKFANTAVFKEIIDLPSTFGDENGGITYYTADDTPNGESINGWGMRVANPRTVLRIGVAREKLTRYEFTIDNYKEFSFLTEKSSVQKGGFIVKHYIDLLIGLNKSSITPLDVDFIVEDDFDNILSREPSEYDVTPELNYLPIGASAGLEFVTWAKRMSRTLYAELGFAPGYGKGIANNFYGKFGIRLGISKISY